MDTPPLGFLSARYLWVSFYGEFPRVFFAVYQRALVYEGDECRQADRKLATFLSELSVRWLPNVFPPCHRDCLLAFDPSFVSNWFFWLEKLRLHNLKAPPCTKNRCTGILETVAFTVLPAGSVGYRIFPSLPLYYLPMSSHHLARKQEKSCHHDSTTHNPTATWYKTITHRARLCLSSPLPFIITYMNEHAHVWKKLNRSVANLHGVHLSACPIRWNDIFEVASI